MEVITLTFQILGVITFLSLLWWGGWELILKGEITTGMKGVCLVIAGILFEVFAISLCIAYAVKILGFI